MKFRLSPIIFIILILLEQLWIFRNISRHQIALWDESMYLYTGYIYHHLISSHQWSQILNMIVTSIGYPFFHEFFLGITTIFTPFTIESARLSSVFWLFPAALSIWLIGKEIFPKIPFFKYLVTLLFLSSPLILFFFSNALKEGVGLSLSWISLYFYLRARRTNSHHFFLLSGLVIIPLSFVKYYYGLYLIAATLLENLIWSLSSKKRSLQIASHLIYYYLPQVTILGYWVFLRPGNYTIIMGYLNNMPDFIVGWREHLLFYPSHLALSYIFSPIIFSLLLFGFVYISFKKISDFRLRLILFFLLVNFISACLRLDKNQARYIFTTVPSFFILGTWGLTELLNTKIILLKNHPLLSFSLIVLTLSSILPDFLHLPDLIRASGSHSVNSAVFYEQHFQQDNYFSFDRNTWPYTLPSTPFENLSQVFAFINTNTDPTTNIIQYNSFNEISPKSFLLQTQNFFSPKLTKTYVLFIVHQNSRFYTKDFVTSNLPYQKKALGFLEQNSSSITAKKYFAFLGLDVIIIGE